MKIEMIILKPFLGGGVFIQEHFTIIFLYSYGQVCFLLGLKKRGLWNQTILVCSGRGAAYCVCETLYIT